MLPLESDRETRIEKALDEIERTLIVLLDRSELLLELVRRGQVDSAGQSRSLEPSVDAGSLTVGFAPRWIHSLTLDDDGSKPGDC